MGVKNARHYTDVERQTAVALAVRLGHSAAAKELGFPKGTVSFWCHQAKQKAKAASDTLSGGSIKAASSGTARPTSGASGPAGAAGGSTSVTPAPASQPTVVASAPVAQRVATGTASPLAGAPPQPAASSGGPSPAPSRARPVAKMYTPSQRAVVVEHAAVHGVGAAAKKHGVSRFSVRDWTRKAAAAAAGERTDSPVSGPVPIPADERERRILEVWRAHPGLGPSQVRNQLRRANFKVSVHTVRLVLDAHGYVTPKIRREHHDQTYEAVRPNHLWHLDFLHRHVHKQPVYLLLIVDDFSRYIVGSALWQGERAEAVLETFEAAVSRHGRPDKAMSDGGSAFYAWRGVSQFTRLLEELEVDQLIATQPQSNGKLEVLNANVQKELFNVETFFDLGEAQRRLRAWVGFYNLRRTHHALGGLLVPADRYFGRADEVLAQLEAGRPADGLGEPMPVGERILDLFRVTSRGGQVEGWLMGQRLLPAMNG